MLQYTLSGSTASEIILNQKKREGLIGESCKWQSNAAEFHLIFRLQRYVSFNDSLVEEHIRVSRGIQFFSRFSISVVFAPRRVQGPVPIYN